MRILIGIALLICATSAQATPSWHWNDRFSDDEKAGLTHWVEHSFNGLEALLGKPPGTFYVHFLRASRSGEPVPWAHTNKGRGRRVYFHVNTDFSWDAFTRDWTAPHELSHLLFPYLGEDSRWFAEGIASYLQYQIMYASGVLSWDEAIARYEDRFRSARSRQGFANLSIVEQSQGGSAGGYVRLYWGGAAYFLHADRQLFLDQGSRLADIIREYSDCCYTPWGTDAAGMIREFDRLSGSTVFSDAYEQTVARSGFPETADALTWLHRNPPQLKGGEVREVARPAS